MFFEEEEHTEIHTEERSPFKSGSRWREGWGGGIGREFEVVYTQLCLKWITSKDLLYSTGNSTQCYVAAWMGGELEGEWIHVYVWPRPLFACLKLSEKCFLFFFSPVWVFHKR